VSAIDREVLDDRLELADVLQNANPLDVDDENAAADEAIRRRDEEGRGRKDEKQPIRMLLTSL